MEKYLRVALMVSFCAMFAANVSGCAKEKEEAKEEVVRQVKTVTVEKGLGAGRTFPGKVQGTQRVNLSFRVSGPLVELPIKEGDEVKKGQLLAKIDPRDFKTAFESARAKYERTEADYKRYLELYEEDAVPLADLETKRAQRDVVKSNLDDAKDALGDIELKAPFDGIIGQRFVENFEDVVAKQEILSMNDISKVEIVINLPENVLATAKGDGNADMYAIFDAIADKKFPVKVKEVATQADAATQTYKATFIMPQPEGVNILPGMTASIELDPREGIIEELVPIIPSTAIFSGDDEKTYVWVVDPDTFLVHKREVKIGQVTGGGNIKVTDGLASGEIVAVAAVRNLREGMKVSLLDQ